MANVHWLRSGLSNRHQGVIFSRNRRFSWKQLLHAPKDSVSGGASPTRTMDNRDLESGGEKQVSILGYDARENGDEEGYYKYDTNARDREDRRDDVAQAAQASNKTTWLVDRGRILHKTRGNVCSDAPWYPIGRTTDERSSGSQCGEFERFETT